MSGFKAKLLGVAVARKTARVFSGLPDCATLGNADEANAPQRAGAGTERCLATNVNVWVEAVRMMIIKNGRVEILNT